MIKTKFPNHAVAPIVEIDCKNCVDFTSAIENRAKDVGVSMRTRATYLNKNSESEPLGPLTQYVKQDDLILIPNTSYASGAMIPRLADFLKFKKLIVIGGDGWGDWSTSYVGKVKSKYPYLAYRMSPWSIDDTSDKTKTFIKVFRSFKGVAPSGNAARLGYTPLTAAISSLKTSKADNKESIRSRLLEAFKQAVKRDPNYMRPTKYAIYEVTQNGERFYGEVSALPEEKK